MLALLPIYHKRKRKRSENGAAVTCEKNSKDIFGVKTSFDAVKIHMHTDQALLFSSPSSSQSFQHLVLTSALNPPLLPCPASQIQLAAASSYVTHTILLAIHHKFWLKTCKRSSWGFRNYSTVYGSNKSWEIFESFQKQLINTGNIWSNG